MLNRPRMLGDSPFDVTLHLDADTVILGNLDFAFAAAEKHGLACCISEHPWLRRYGKEHGDLIEYNAGVIFFSKAAKPVIDRWREESYKPQPESRFMDGSSHVTLPPDDQFGFSKAIADEGCNPYVLPQNYNYRPDFMGTMFTPIKIWHSYYSVPLELARLSERCERGERLTTYLRKNQ
jgi:lipopolysaccharide biosynthesis glycosyltransferase